MKNLSFHHLAHSCGDLTRSGIAAFLLAACTQTTTSGGLDEDTATGDPPATATVSAYLRAAAECGSFGRAPCDVLDATCQSELAAIAACQWGGEGTPVTVPPVTTLSRADLLMQLEMSPGAAAPPEPRDVAFSSALRLLGLEPPASDDAQTPAELSASLVLAFYAFDTRQATLVADARTGDPATDDSILFHELVHAQQDARYDLGGLLRGVTSTDALLALRGLFEGEAQFHQLLFEMGQYQVSSGPAAVKTQLDAFRDFQQPALFADPASAWQRSLLLGAYIYGPYSTLDAWSEGGPEAMLELYDNPRAESLRMLETAFDENHTTDPFQPFPATNVYAQPGSPAPVAGDEAYPLVADRLGAWTVFVLAALAENPTLARELALAWRGDQLDVFQLAAGGAAGRFRANFDDADHAAQFARVMSKNPNAAIRTSGPLVVVAVSEGDIPEWLFGPLAMP